MDRNSSKYWNPRHYRSSISAYSSFRLEKIFVVIFSLNRNYKRKGFHSRVSNNFPKVINPNLHNVRDCVRGLHGDGEGHDPLPLCLDVMWCPLRRWFTHRPEGTLGLQSFLHSRRHVVHEQGFGPPPQDNTEPRELARTRTLKTRRDRAIFNRLLKGCAFTEGAECKRFRPVFRFLVSCGLDWVTAADTQVHGPCTQLLRRKMFVVCGTTINVSLNRFHQLRFQQKSGTTQYSHSYHCCNAWLSPWIQFNTPEERSSFPFVSI